MTDQAETAMAEQTNPFTSVPIEVVVSVGRARPMIRDLVNLGQDAVLELDRKVDDPVELYVGDKLIARGMLEESGQSGAPGALSVRLTQIIDLKNGLE